MIIPHISKNKNRSKYEIKNSRRENGDYASICKIMTHIISLFRNMGVTGLQVLNILIKKLLRSGHKQKGKNPWKDLFVNVIGRQIKAKIVHLCCNIDNYVLEVFPVLFVKANKAEHGVQDPVLWFVHLFTPLCYQQ